MTDYGDLREQLEQRLADLLERADVIEDDLRHPLEADSSEQAIDLGFRCVRHDARVGPRARRVSSGLASTLDG